MSRVPPTYIGYRSGSNDAQVIVEVFLDLLCPFSKKAFLRLKEVVDHYKNQVQVRIINFVQPWHPQAYYLSIVGASTYFASNKSSPGSGDAQFLKYFDLAFDRQADFSDEKVAQKTADQLLTESATLAASVTGLSQETILQVAKEDPTIIFLKIHQKYGRQNGIHVTPTYLINGLNEASISSSWTLEQWTSFLDPILKLHS